MVNTPLGRTDARVDCAAGMPALISSSSSTSHPPTTPSTAPPGVCAAQLGGTGWDRLLLAEAGQAGRQAGQTAPTHWRCEGQLLLLTPPSCPPLHCSYPNFTLHTGAGWKSVEPTADGKQVRVTSAKGDEGLFDFLVVSTGMLTDARLRPELKAVADKIATW